jgi:hypothetical protein
MAAESILQDLLCREESASSRYQVPTVAVKLNTGRDTIGQHFEIDGPGLSAGILSGSVFFPRPTARLLKGFKTSPEGPKDAHFWIRAQAWRADDCVGVY